MKKFFITESETKRIKSIYFSKGILTENILNEGIPGLKGAVKVGMEQGLKDASKVEIKKLLKSSNPTKNVDELFDKFEKEYASSKNPDKVIEKYFKNSSESALEDFCRILAKENPASFSRYSLDIISTPETSRVIRYAVEHPEKYSKEQLEKIYGGYKDLINNLETTDAFTLEVRQNLETQYGEKLKKNLDNKGGSGSKQSQGGKSNYEKDRPVQDSDFGYSSEDFKAQIQKYMPPKNPWDEMGDKFGSVPVVNRATSEYVKNLNKLEKNIDQLTPNLKNISEADSQTIADLINAYTSKSIARGINSKQIETMYRNLMTKLNSQDAALVKQLADAGTSKGLKDIQTGYKNIDIIIGILGKRADPILNLISVETLKKVGKYSSEWGIVGLTLWYLLSKLSSDSSVTRERVGRYDSDESGERQRKSRYD